MRLHRRHALEKGSRMHPPVKRGLCLRAAAIRAPTQAVEQASMRPEGRALASRWPPQLLGIVIVIADWGNPSQTVHRSSVRRQFSPTGGGQPQCGAQIATRDTAIEQLGACPRIIAGGETQGSPTADAVGDQGKNCRRRHSKWRIAKDCRGHLRFTVYHVGQDGNGISSENIGRKCRRNFGQDCPVRKERAPIGFC